MSGDVSTPVEDTPAPGTGAFRRLSLVELRRYTARAGVRWLVVGMLAIVLLTAFGAWRASRPPSPALVQQAQQQFEMAQTDWAQNGEQIVASCRAAQEQQVPASGPKPDFACDRMAPTLANFLPRQATFAESGKDWVGQVATFVLLLALIIGATFVAAEFSTGAISTWLTFEPRRGRVFASKAFVVTVATGVVAFVVAALAALTCWAATAVHHAVGDMTPALWTDLGDSAGRVAAAAAGAALLGAALGFLLRHTAAVIAVVIGWFIAIDGILLSGLLHAPRWSAQLSLQAWLSAGATYYQEAPCTTGPNGEMFCGGAEKSLSMAQGGLTLAVLVVLVTMVAVRVFQRRDVA